MSCSSLSVLTHLAMFIGSHFLNGTVYKDDVGRVTALRLANTDPHTHYTSYTVLSHPVYSNCFEKSNPLLLNDISTKWIPKEPLDTWDRSELADELVECKNSFRTLKHRHITQGKNLYSIKKLLFNRITASKALSATPKPEKKISLRPITIQSHVPSVPHSKSVTYHKERKKETDPLRHNLIVPVTRMSPVFQKKYTHSILHPIRKRIRHKKMFRFHHKKNHKRG